MRSSKLAGATMLMVGTLLTGCTSEESPTAPLTPTLALMDAGHNTADHFRIVEAAAFEVESPCNGELIAFSGTSISQLTLVGTREDLDAGRAVHSEFQSHTRASGLGPESGASYTINDLFHDGFNSPSPLAPQSTFRFGGMFHVTSAMPGLSFDGHFGFQAVSLPGGGLKVTRDVGELVCKA